MNEISYKKLFMPDNNVEDYTDLDIKNEYNDDNSPKVILNREMDNLYELYCSKNEDYGNSFSILRREFPESILIRLSDKVNRLKNLYKNGKVSENESYEDTLKDIALYSLMELVEIEMEKYDAD